MLHSQFKRFVLGLTSCAFGLILMFPATSWAITYTYDLSGLGFTAGSVLRFNGTIGSLTFAPNQSIAEMAFGQLYQYTRTTGPLDTLSITDTHPVDASFCGTSVPACNMTRGITGFIDSTQSLAFGSIAPTSDCIDIPPGGRCTRFLPTRIRNRPLDASDPRLQAVPEPAAIVLFATGIIGLGGYRWQQRRREGTQVA